jgi:uncharacterized protein (TIGR02217 family)
MMALFNEARFNTGIRYGTVGGPTFSTDVETVTSGQEQRNANWKDSKGKWQVGDDLFNRQEIDHLIAFFRERKGKAGGFRFKDWSDYEAKFNIETLTIEGVVVEVEGTTDLQMAKEYKVPNGTTIRLITKPVPGTIKFWQPSTPVQDPVTGVWTFGTEVTGGGIDYTTGKIAGGSTGLRWTGEFDVPARFDTDQFNSTFEGYRDSDGEALFSVSGLTIVEINQNPITIPLTVISTIGGGVANPAPSGGGTGGSTGGTGGNTGGSTGGTGGTSTFTVTISPTPPIVTTVATNTGSATVTTPPITATAVGGQSGAVYTYVWEKLDGDIDQTLTDNSYTGATKQMTSTVTTTQNSVATWRVRVTDQYGTTVYSDNISVTLTATGSLASWGTAPL